MLWQYYAEIGWVTSLAVFYGISVFMEKKAAMRGTNREPLSPVADRSLRLFFLFILSAPVIYIHPYIFGPIVLLYLPSFIDQGEKTGKRVSSVVKNAFIWRWIAKYFSLSVVAAGEKLDPKKSYIIGCHPHGFLPIGTMVNCLTNITKVNETFLNGVPVRTLAASFCFYIPIYRDIVLGGGVIDAARYNARAALDEGYSIILVPGGATEGLYAHPGPQRLVLRKRHGFVKLAIETGAHLVPAFSFGETDCYRQLSSKWPWVKKFQHKFQRIFGLSLPLVTNIIPRRTKITTVFGAPIPVEKNENPTHEQVDAVLEKYIKALHELFDAHAEKYIKDPEHRKLIIVQ
jgi:2-acylglycerol O-acyltransferase 2